MFFFRVIFLIRRAGFQKILFALSLITPTILEASESPSIEHIVTGQWRFTKPIDSANITSLDESEAAQLVGHIFTIRKDKVSFDDRDCGETEFEAKKVEPTSYLLKEFNSKVEGLKLPNPVTVVEITCTAVFVRSSNRLVIFWKGWFFDAIRVKK
jgi:hypothetical protein